MIRLARLRVALSTALLICFATSANAGVPTHVIQAEEASNIAGSTASWQQVDAAKASNGLAMTVKGTGFFKHPDSSTPSIEMDFYREKKWLALRLG